MAKRTGKKIYVIDTNVFLSDFNAVYAFKTNDIVVPLKVLEEIDKHKKRQDGVGANARQIIRVFDKLRDDGNLHDGVKIGKGYGTLSVRTFGEERLPHDMSMQDPDNQILATVLAAMKANPDKNIVLVSQDINMRVKADSLGIESEDYTLNQIVQKVDEVYTGFTNHLVDDNIIDLFYTGNKVYMKQEEVQLYPNQFVMLVSNINEKKTALCRFKGYDKPLVKVREFKEGVWGLKAKNREQQFALDLLMDPDVKLVSLVGMAGTGKTLIAIAAALQQTLDMGMYKKIVVTRPVEPVGKSIGFLPGPQPLTAKILTPNGWTTMGQLQIGDEVIAGNGKPTKILGIYPKGIKPVYKVTTTDGTNTECCEDHLWLTQNHNERKHNKKAVVRTTREIIDTLTTNKSKPNHFIPRNQPVQYKASNLPLAPYTLGCLIGDGSFGDAIILSNTDLDLVKKVEEQLKEYNCSLQNGGKTISYQIRSNLYNNKPAKQVSITNTETNEVKIFASIGKALEEIDINRSTLHHRCEKNMIIEGLKYEFLDELVRWQNPIKNIIHNLGLLNKKAWEKFIPDQYKYQSSVEDRIELLRGLMDTDGSVKKSGEASYTTTSKQLALDIIELVRSLGGRATLCERNRVGKKTKIGDRTITTRRVSYEFTISLSEEINPFYISRKANRFATKYMHGVGIKSVELVGEKEVQCILVEDESHLYITDDFIVTHNTLEEKMAPWVAPIQDNLEFLMGEEKENLLMLQEQGTIEVEAITFIRGRSIANAIMIVDESQNITIHEIKTILTRIGENTKIILTGDINQVDNVFLDPTNNGLTHAVEKLKPYDITGHVTLLQGERSAVADLAATVL